MDVPTPLNALPAHPGRSDSHHGRVRSEMSLGGPLSNVTPSQRWPKCTIHHDLTGSAPSRPLDGKRGSMGQQG